jgi:hypothetical protein
MNDLEKGIKKKNDFYCLLRRLFVCNLYLLVFSFYLLALSCGQRQGNLEKALRLAGNNRPELEKVLRHYSLNAADSLKLAAAQFLIKNMPGHFSSDTSYIRKLKPVYDGFEKISSESDWYRSSLWAERVDSLERAWWELFLPVSSNSVTVNDIESIRSEWLIDHIDLAFKAWYENFYTKNLSFQSFCEYILPYRFGNRVELDDAQMVFYQRYHHYFDGSYGTFMNATDSVLYQMKDLINNMTHGRYATTIYNYRDLEQIRFIRCEDRCWYNALSLSSTGMAVAIDCVPAWGNRNNNHSWNALIIDEEVFPFEPFWDNDRWKYKVIYNNSAIDTIWGKLQIPKVFRKAFSMNPESPFTQTKNPEKNVPPFFRDVFLKDVSNQYFNTVNISVPIPDSIRKTPEYAYLCVYNYRNWVPVHWGKIKDRVMQFEDMGKEIVYMAAFYLDNRLIPVSFPFSLCPQGEIKYLTSSKEVQDITLQTFGHYINITEREAALRPMNGVSIKATEELSGNSSLIALGSIDLATDISDNKKIFPQEVNARYIIFDLPTDTIALSEIIIYTREGTDMQPIQNIRVITELNPLYEYETPDMMFDNLSGKGFIGLCKEKNTKRVIFDLGAHYPIAALNYIPYIHSLIKPGNTYKLYYWDGGWQLGGEQEGSSKTITFRDIPKGTIYRVEAEVSQQERHIERIFTCENGKVTWW